MCPNFCEPLQGARRMLSAGGCWWTRVGVRAAEEADTAMFVQRDGASWIAEYQHQNIHIWLACCWKPGENLSKLYRSERDGPSVQHSAWHWLTGCQFKARRGPTVTSPSFLKSGLGRRWWSAPSSDRFNPSQTPALFLKDVAWASGPVWRRENVWLPTRF
jgi:hypothetical protein